jgi:hypothetical protein
MIGRLSTCVAVGVLLAGIGAQNASAQFGVGAGLGAMGGAGGYGFGFFNYGGGINNSNDHIPFYSLYPPVYYSFPVPRSYGYSPFAYPPGVTTPDLPPAAEEIMNPHVPQSTEPKPAAVRTAGPRTYLNPFVQPAQLASKPAAE